MSNQTQSTEEILRKNYESETPPEKSDKLGSVAIKALILLITFIAGSVGGYFMGRQSMHDQMSSSDRSVNTPATEGSLMEQINSPTGYKILAVFGNVGPELVASGAIDMDKFVSLYQQQNRPLTNQQMDILTKETVDNIVITPQNAYFLLNFFWALGLTNDNKILTQGQIMSGGKSQVGRFASTGGWTIGAKPAVDLFASKMIISLTDEQQARLEEVTAGVYRPCCDNPTHFPDCNHGMAMLGLLELMASQNASVDEMYEAAKYVNAYWYPQQTLEIATLFRASQQVEFADADARSFVSAQYSSGSGYRAVHQYLSDNGLLEQAPSSGGSCGVQ